ncbi:hypothetical protein CEF21_13345 [Bacillus sp. FJAT-42376]|uniref:hypothetical protein n=1 Tax=Bacillus sp. FJAT-42376 TaxID=2014076 RepID=UPI000F4EB67E|nr:hypothetical protein [Bacillus sp. FJAT-42376]AZB44864.1 hypothetical protein CEF21_13345 [Bacillus sp. FJAT-42376]
MTSKYPKFKMGEVVVIVLYGTVGTVTNVYKLNQSFLYEVNHGDVLFFESALSFYKEYEGKIFEIERIEVEYQFAIGDLVHVTGYGKDLFKIVGLRTEIWRYLEDGWEDMVYELMRVADGEWLEAAEEEMILVMSNNEAEKSLHQIMLMLNKEGSEGEAQDEPAGLKTGSASSYSSEKTEKKKDPGQLVNDLLDIYNDYRLLYLQFGDPEYKEMMQLVLDSLKRFRPH